MGAPVQVWKQPVRAFPLVRESGQIELLKWLGLAVMLIAHVAEYVGGVTSGWAINAGQLAFPLFAAALAATLSEDIRGRSHRLVFRLMPFALVAQLFSMTMRDGFVLNVLFQFIAAGAWLRAGTELETWTKWGLRACALVVAFLAEFSLVGLLLVVGAVRLWQWERPGYFWLMVAPALAGISLFEGGAYFFWSVPVVAVVARVSVLELPRAAGAFAWLYAGHFGAIWLWRQFL